MTSTPPLVDYALRRSAKSSGFLMQPPLLFRLPPLPHQQFQFLPLKLSQQPQQGLDLLAGHLGQVTGRRVRRDHLSCRGRCGGCDNLGRSQARPLQAPRTGYSCANPPRLILRDSRPVQDWQWDEVHRRVELRWPDDGVEHRVQTSLSRWQRIPESRQYE